MKRREFAMGWSLAARAEQPAMPVFRFPGARSPEYDAYRAAGVDAVS